MRYFSLFSGIGGFELGIYQADKNSTCVGYSEIDQYAIKIYKNHFHHTNYGDTTKIDTNEIPDFDLLVGGFPCQSFSIAGKRLGFHDTRGTLFFEIARILADKRPKHVLLENVKGLLSHDGGQTFQTMLGILADLGYSFTEWQILNSKDFGVPQNRERVFIVGHLRGGSGRQIFPLRQDSGKDIEVHKGKKEIASTLTCHYAKNQSDAQYLVHNVYGGFKEKKPREFHDVSPTIRTAKGGGHLPSVVSGAKIRRLTPVECERLQGFPDGWTDGVSDTQRYKTLGNAVTVNVVQAIIKQLMS